MAAVVDVVACAAVGGVVVAAEPGPRADPVTPCSAGASSICVTACGANSAMDGGESGREDSATAARATITSATVPPLTRPGARGRAGGADGEAPSELGPEVMGSTLPVPPCRAGLAAVLRVA